MDEIQPGDVVRFVSGDLGIVMHESRLVYGDWIIYSFTHQRELMYRAEVFQLTNKLTDEEWAQIAEYRLLT